MYDNIRKTRALSRKALALITSALIALSFTSSARSYDEFNGTVYSLGLKEVVVVQPVNASKLNLTLSQKSENITLLDLSGARVGFNSSYLFWRGDHIYSLNFDRNVTGKLTYIMPQQGQQFILPLRGGEPVRIILPAGYTTGNRVLGIASPAPDDFQEGDSGSVLTWYNTSQIPYIEVSYYKNNALQALTKIFAIMALAAIVLLAEYYYSIRKLRSIRKDVEENARHKI